MKSLLVIFLAITFTQEIPYKDDDQFTIKFSLDFKQRPSSPLGMVNFTETRDEKERRTSSDPLPYLTLNIIVNKALANEAKLKVVRDSKELVFSKKVSSGMEFKLDVGFTDDLKDQVQGFLHVISFYDSKKNVVSKIVIEFDKDGNYLVNGVKRGKV